MGFRFRKSFKIAPAVKFNLGGKSAGFSVGGKHGGASWNSRSGTHVRASAHGTGVSYRKKVVGKKKKTSSKPGSGGLVFLAAFLLAGLATIDWAKLGGGLIKMLPAAGGILALFVLLKLVLWFASREKNTEAPEPAAPVIEDVPVTVTWEPESKPEPVQRLKPENYDQYCEIELARPESVFPRKPNVGALLDLKPDPLYPRDSKAVKACWVYEREERIAGYIKKSDADLRNLMREYWSAGGRVDAQVRYNYDALGIFIGFKK